MIDKYNIDKQEIDRFSISSVYIYIFFSFRLRHCLRIAKFALFYVSGELEGIQIV